MFILFPLEAWDCKVLRPPGTCQVQQVVLGFRPEEE